MKIMRFSLFFSVFILLSDCCYAAPKYQASQIIEQIKKSKADSYLKGDLLIGKSLVTELKKGNKKIIKQFETEVDKINNVLEKDDLNMIYNWVIQYYPTEGIVCGHHSQRK